jgi:hypothetical protein
LRIYIRKREIISHQNEWERGSKNMEMKNNQNCSNIEGRKRAWDSCVQQNAGNVLTRASRASTSASINLSLSLSLSLSLFYPLVLTSQFTLSFFGTKIISQHNITNVLKLFVSMFVWWKQYSYILYLRYTLLFSESKN